MLNNAQGAFSVLRQITAPNAGSCGSLYDFDNDGDLDMVLADEIAEVVLLYRNGPGVLFGNGFEPLP